MYHAPIPAEQTARDFAALNRFEREAYPTLADFASAREGWRMMLNWQASLWAPRSLPDATGA